MEPQTVKPNPWIVPFSIIIAGALVGGGIFLSSKETKQFPNGSDRRNQVVGAIQVNPITEKDHIRGNPNAPVAIIEFSDTECPYCKQFHQTMKMIMDEYGAEGKVAWVYRHMPIDNLHKKARKEAEASECAASIGGKDVFWKYIDAIYEKTNSNDSLDPSELPKIAGSLGLDVDKFNTCLSGGQFAQVVTDHINDGQKAGARGTPYSVLIAPNGEKIAIEGAYPYDVVKSIIDTALSDN